MKVTLEQLRNQIAGVATDDDYMLQGWIAAIDAHLAQPRAVPAERVQSWLIDGLNMIAGTNGCECSSPRAMAADLLRRLAAAPSPGESA